MTALAESACDDPRIGRSLDYLERTLESGMTPMSLAWSLMGLTAHGRRPPQADEWIDASLTDERWLPLGANDAALLLLAAQATMSGLPGSAAVATVGASR
jgi:hypothetical protein